MAQATAAELLDDDVVTGRVRIEEQNPFLDALPHCIIQFRGRAQRPAVMTGIGQIPPLPVHHLNPFGMIEALAARAMLLRVFLFEIQIERPTMGVAVAGKHGRISLVTLIE
jgi:hypothetical protein